MVSSRTPEGTPNGCPVCGKSLSLEPDAKTPCPHCGYLLLFSGQDETRIELSAAEPKRFLDGLDSWACRPDPRRLVLDLGDIQFVSSIVLGKLITLSNKAKATGGQLVLCNVRKEVAEVFQVTKLDQLFEIQG
jgi:anti-anti-sigma factor